MASPFTTYKLIILYMLQNSEGDLTNSQITDFILDWNLKLKSSFFASTNCDCKSATVSDFNSSKYALVFI